MSGEGVFGRLGLLTLILLVVAAALFALTRPAGDASADSTLPSATPKIELLSQAVKAVRVEEGGNPPIYRVNIDYYFRNPGIECSVRFDLPSGNPGGGDRELTWQVFEDGAPVAITPLSSGETTLELAGKEYGWRSKFKQGQIKTIRLNYEVEPNAGEIDGTIELGGRELPVTGIEAIFKPVVEWLSLPLGSDAIWVDRIGDLQVEIDLGRRIPASMVSGSPQGYEYDGRRLNWRIDEPIRGAVFEVRVMRVADALFRMDDARKVVRTLTDETYQGYKRDLSQAQRRWYLRVVRNGIFAKYGFGFRGEMRDYFDDLAWYVPNRNYSDDMLSQEELDIIKLILEAEERL